MEKKKLSKELSEIKADFIGNYLDKHMKGHGLPYGFAYFNLLDEKERKAEIAWNNRVSKIKRCNECLGTGKWKENERDKEINCPKCGGYNYLTTSPQPNQSKKPNQ